MDALSALLCSGTYLFREAELSNTKVSSRNLEIMKIFILNLALLHSTAANLHCLGCFMQRKKPYCEIILPNSPDKGLYSSTL